MIDVFLKDGQTVFRLQRRVQLVQLVKRDAEFLEDDGPIPAYALWQRNESQEWEPANLMFLHRGSIAFVRKVEREDAEIFGELVRARMAEEVPA